uniref:Uncharacterized protein n=1 Tax=Schistosoma haematobium TaxID=6185 RepID=A0A094ZHP8_SCHHA
MKKKDKEYEELQQYAQLNEETLLYLCITRNSIRTPKSLKIGILKGQTNKLTNHNTLSKIV